ncbi:glycosyltransferase family 2 protein [Pedobacter sp. MC2016-15]|uniref:glycosyltransferase family 2 protein n=1 Tax=Pedobacter sp. MC2016-15 TaxID=2994473 RepID=UPI0022453A6B|nr:glycosyltransferase family 2 protein [Pedobacter sp. MC2016-15]MCX2478655.1 glycosyltransferase family 2 protein [Pedobacter sp. MC2016-15]
MNNLKVSLIISTYNWPDALNLCLESVLRQTVVPSEVVIADDGSTHETEELILHYAKSFPVPLKHVWQEDEGFQLSKIRNKAIAAATGDYIIQIDGDLILERHYIEDHIIFSKKNSFVSGSRVIMKKELSKKLLKTHQTKISLFTKGLTNVANGLRIPFLSKRLETYKNDDVYYLRGCNMAFWRSDLIKVNGYNEAFTGWGREDNEIGLRLINSGVEKRVIKFSGIVFHIYHPEKTRTGLNINDELLKQTALNKLTYCTKGLSQYLL